ALLAGFIEKLERKGTVTHEALFDGHAICAPAELQWELCLAVRPSSAPPCLMVARRVDDQAVQVGLAHPVAVLKLAVLVKVGKPIDDEIPADEVDVVSRIQEVLEERIMTRQFRQPESACHLSPLPSDPA